MKNHLFNLFFLSFLSITIISCDKEDDANEEEVITTLIYTLKPIGSGDEVIMTFKDLDGDGGLVPIVTTIGKLKSNLAYSGSLIILNESKTPADNITEEVAKEALEHQLFFEVSGNLVGKLDISYDDKDSENNPIGLLTKVKATAIGLGKLKVTLRHEPNKKAAGVSNGSIANAGGETDIEVSFDIEAIQ